LAFSGVLCLGGAEVLKAAYGIPIEFGTIGIAVFVGSYTMVGGLPAVVKTDEIQFFGVIILLILGCIALVRVSNGPFSTEDWFISAKSTISSSDAIALGIAFALGEAFIPIYSVRGIIGDKAKTVKIAFVLGAIMCMVWFLFTGLFGAS